MGGRSPQSNEAKAFSIQTRGGSDRTRKLTLFKGKHWIAAGTVGATAIIFLITGIVVRDWARLQANPTEDSKRKFDGSLSIATTAATIVTGIFLVLNYFSTQEKNKIDAAFADKRLTMERFTKAVEMLGSENIHVRLGGIYSLEGIANDSNPNNPDEDYRQIFEVLTAFVRENSPYSSKEKKQKDLLDQAQSTEETEGAVPTGDEPEAISPLPTDIQAVLAVIQRRKHRETDHQHFKLDLRRSDLGGASFQNANLQEANLMQTNLQEASLDGANLQGANLQGSFLQGSFLNKAKLQKAFLENANLQKAILTEADLTEAVLTEAQLTEAILEDANLQKTNLLGANLIDADIKRANLQGAILVGAKLQGAVLLIANLTEAILHDAKLQDALLLGANLQKGNLIGADLQMAQLDGATLEGSDLSKTNLQGASLTNANFQRVNLVGANLRQADLWNTNLQEAKFWYSEDLPQAEEKTKAMLISARNWEKAEYDLRMRELLELPPEHLNSD